jgi:hypothetical protein
MNLGNFDPTRGVEAPGDPQASACGLRLVFSHRGFQMKYASLAAVVAVFLPSFHVHGSEPFAALDGFKVRGTMKQIIGTFSTYGHPEVGDAFELDFAKLPSEKITLVRPNFDPQQDVTPYIPYLSPLEVANVEQGDPKIGGTVVVLRSTSSSRILVVQLRARELKQAEPVRIYFYEEQSGKLQ